MNIPLEEGVNGGLVFTPTPSADLGGSPRYLGVGRGLLKAWEGEGGLNPLPPPPKSRDTRGG